MTSLDNQSGVADDGHLTRIVRLETQMDTVASTLASLQRTQELLQRTQEQHYQATLAGFEAMRNRMDDRINDVERHMLERLERSERSINQRIDKLTYWVIGILLANTSATVGILVRLMLN